MRYIVFYSSGIGSFHAALKIKNQCQQTDTILCLFADTGVEDPDNYRFLDESAEFLGVDLVKVKNVKYANIFENWQGRRAIANNRMPFCSFDMKHKPCRDWLSINGNPATDILVVGISWDEIHRLPAIEKGWSPYPVVAPLTEPPLIDKIQMIDKCKALGISPPRLYEMGFPHANCGGGCVRAGHSQWRHLLKINPSLFKNWEEEEAKMQDFLEKSVTILKKQGKPYSLKQLRIDVENNGQLDLFDWGGCNCFLDEEDEKFADLN